MAPTPPDAPMTAEELDRVVSDLENAVRAFVRWRREMGRPNVETAQYVDAIAHSVMRECGMTPAESFGHEEEAEA